MTPRPLSTKDLFRPLQYVAGVGPDRADLLAKLELKTVADVLFYFPRTYEDLTTTVRIDQLVEGAEATVVGVVHSVERQVTRAGKVIVGVLVAQENQLMRALWFNPTFGIKDLQKGAWVAVRGAPKRKTMRWEMIHPKVMRLDLPTAPPLEQLAKPGLRGADVAAASSRPDDPSADSIWLGKYRPVYGLTEGLNQREMRKITTNIVRRYADLLEEALTADLIERHQLCSITQAVHGIHCPQQASDVEIAQSRLVYQELFALQLGLAMRRYRMTANAQSPILTDTAKIRGRILRLFPFELTNDQQQAIDQVCEDMGRAIPMNRMLQGDVGSGKTVVAIYSLLLCVAHGYQAALMAPTEILARQHFNTLQKQLKSSRVRMGLMTGSVSAVDRAKLESDLAAGKIDIVVGTQSLVRGNIPWQRLGLVIIDEGHKFGVKQRAKLKQGGCDPHYLVMTATPIPRSAAMTLFGDLDLSVIRQTPPGRQPVKSYLVELEKRDSWWQFMRKQVEQGRQAFVVVPRIETQADDDQTVTATRIFEELTQGVLQGLRVELLHGQMSGSDKQRIMKSFHRGLTQVLVSTTVIEVGIDVPNANCMAICSPQRLGLSQLHQLRGRVGRGSHAGYVGLVLDEISQPETRERLQLFCRTTDGFELAEADLKIRGPGDLFGTRQHGLPPLLIADLFRDHEWLVKARNDAQALVQADPELADPSRKRLRQLVMGKYGKVLELGDVG
ncbi:MAG: ATP-dependent DNA helicase RecG [Planctomycetaceae bacterium]|nr:ATP-dependent DNA helicase RecG [Planctomycetaceae bacterium]